MAHLVGQPNATAFHDPLARVPLDRLSIPLAGFAMDLFTQLFGSLLAFVYHRFDRIVIYGYLSG